LTVADDGSLCHDVFVGGVDAGGWIGVVDQRCRRAGGWRGCSTLVSNETTLIAMG
jgi:hypothetical protein